MPMRRRSTRQYVTTPEGTRELHIYFGVKELTLDEPDLISFGEALLEHDQFMAGSATAWSVGEPYPWERVRELLEALLAEELLSREAPKPSSEGQLLRRFLESEARRAAPSEPLWWNPDCPRVMERLVGQPLELGFLETVLPAYRLAHPALDAEGRHVGEMSVFPDAMRMKLPTERRTCPYPGSRYREEAPMNLTALKSMTRHWKPVLRAVLAVREEFLRHHPLLPDGRWRLGDLHALSYVVLALPSLLLMRANAPVPNGMLDPVLSSLFRVTDGVRMVTSYLLLLLEGPVPYDTPTTAAELLRVTEQANLYLSTRGVCAGPPHMVEDFFATLLEGKPVTGAPIPPAAWEAELPAAMDYGLLGLQLYSLQSTHWSRMCHAYDVIHTALLEVEEEPGGVLGRLRAHVERDWQLVQLSGLHHATPRALTEAAFSEMYARAQRGRRGFREGAPQHLRDAFTPAGDEVDGNARLRLRELMRSRAGAPSGARGDVLDAVADAVAEFLALERSALRVLEGTQRQVNALLQRPHPARKLSGADLSLGHRLRIGTTRMRPYLLDVLREELGITVENTEDATRCGLASS
ncbi:Hypothetical protein AA314_07870 [Archangium gephyra]|uniref:Uncharacterized protein n=1 Tax=Archangium gephyra TaxID=48 RepID=A0AAC8QF02_9BACT|nr:Hypothetical protein AA314_07870 [Archangium gephyra]